MKKTTRIINEGFMRKYMKEDLFDSLKREIKRKLKNAGYDVEAEGADNLIEAAAEYIEMTRDFESDKDYSVDTWIKETELNYPEELEFMKSMNESTELNLGPLSFKSDLGTKVIDNADKISKTVSTLSPLLADDASEKEEIKSKEVFHNDNGQDYDVIERSSSGKNALLKRGNKWIVAWNCPKDSGSWGQGHYFFDEESARKVWKDEYLNESLEEDDHYKFQSDVYNALSDVMFKWRDSGIDESDMSKALTWFDIHFWEDEEY